MKIIAIIIGKILLFIGKLLKRGSSLPGKIALKIAPNLLVKFKYPLNRIIVTGSSGKGGTSSLIAQVLREQGFKVCHNTNGSNLSSGLTTALIAQSSLTGKIKADYLVLELDERYNKEVLKYLKPNYLVLTNLTKDQPPRQHYVDIVFDELASCIPKETTIVTLMDEPLLRALETPERKIIYFTLAKNKYSNQKQIFENLNNTLCPNCQVKLEYEYYNFETLGKYKCPNCSFKYLPKDVIATDLDLEKETFNIEKETIKLGGDTLYEAYNTLAAYTLLKELNIPRLAKTINQIHSQKTLPYFQNNGKTYRYFNCKSENATTFNHALFKISETKELKDIIIGWSIISKRYPHTDVSWLYDIEFELLNNVHKIYLCGPNKEDLKTRLILAGFNEEILIVKNNLTECKPDILNSEAPYVFCLSHYDYQDIFNKTFKEEQ